MSVFEIFLVHVFSYSVGMRENTDQKNSKYGHFSRSKRRKKNLINLFKVIKIFSNVIQIILMFCLGISGQTVNNQVHFLYYKLSLLWKQILGVFRMSRKTFLQKSLLVDLRYSKNIAELCLSD